MDYTALLKPDDVAVLGCLSSHALMHLRIVADHAWSKQKGEKKKVKKIVDFFRSLENHYHTFFKLLQDWTSTAGLKEELEFFTGKDTIETTHAKFRLCLNIFTKEILLREGLSLDTHFVSARQRFKCKLIFD